MGKGVSTEFFSQQCRRHRPRMRERNTNTLLGEPLFVDAVGFRED
jgi:hypothetical protein